VNKLGRNDEDFFTRLAREKNIILKLIGALERGEPLEPMLLKLLERIPINDYEKNIKRQIRKKIKTQEFVVLTEMLLNYKESSDEEFSRIARKLLQLAEKKAYKSHLEQQLNKRLLIKIILVSTMLSFTTVTAILTFPRILSMLNQERLIPPEETITLIIMISALYIVVTYTTILVITKSKRKAQISIAILIAILTIASLLMY